MCLLECQITNDSPASLCLCTCDDIHHTEEDSCAETPGVAGHDLHDDREEDGEPSFSKEVVESQSYEAVGRAEVESQGGEGSSEDQEAGLDPEPGVEAKPGLELVGDETSWREDDDDNDDEMVIVIEFPETPPTAPPQMEQTVSQ